MEPVVVEIVDRRGRVRERRRFDSFPITIGRGYRSDWMLDDPYVSAEHLRVAVDDAGETVIEDLASANGTWIEQGGAGGERGGTRIDRVRLDSDLTLRLGETTLRLRRPDHPVDEALPLAAAPPWRGRLPMPLLALLALGLLSGVDATFLYFSTYEKLEASRFVMLFLVESAALAVWSGLWALGNRILAPRFQFADHFLNAVFWDLAFGLATLGVSVAGFAMAADRALDVASWLVAGTMFAGLLYGHIRLCSPATSLQVGLRAAGMSVLVTATIAGITFTPMFEETWYAVPRYRSELKPGVFKLAASDSVDEFLARGGGLRERVDEIVREDAP